MNKEDIILKHMLNNIEQEMLNNNIEAFKTSAKNLVKETLKILEDTQTEWKIRHNSTALIQKLSLIHTYLDCLRRFCESSI